MPADRRVIIQLQAEGYRDNGGICILEGEITDFPQMGNRARRG